MILELLGHDFGYRLEHIIRLFYPNEKIAWFKEKYSGCDRDIITTLVREDADCVFLFVKVVISNYEKSISKNINKELDNKEIERKLCILLFKLLSEQTSINPPWGILTGVRPVRKMNNLLRQGLNSEEAENLLIKKFMVSPQKARLTLDTSSAQIKTISKIKENSCSVYISIPFCPTRCIYCSFVSHAIENTHQLLDEYLKFLCIEIHETSKVISNLGLELQSIYIGGGTPTILNPDQISILLRTVEECLETKNLIEYTFEAGRPDTITIEKLNIIKSFEVNRISINPQTLNQSILDEIGRKHSVEDFFSAFSEAREVGFSSINTDLIVGLPKEDESSFKLGLERIIELNPENITIHTLTNKRASDLKANLKEYNNKLNVLEILEYTNSRLKDSGYSPYYLYRQKGTLENQENVGYSKTDKQSLYNIAMMEEVQTVIGIGAGATTRLNLPDGKIKRVYNLKYPYEYLKRFDEVMERKNMVREHYEEYK